ncbi:PREDICTED: RNA polymerase II elongation factor ELL isoform X2 [Ceratosolen solmsi marchali]|uniref:RNA polymerase II elongation factor ELL isoform X2 n=1 Tax=Ceratosolen solmsi marchali TaxID=326594 RepID=A0AAJ6YRA5_9HYME|nr:PREDICTED: RNA polymerase II elongation factor ELL isoform X2 [Ceratosolen solmsi marchali]
MAALVAGVQYGLSSHSNFYENKSLIFVKLTDSAQRAIEDYVRNRHKINENPTIQFLGNEGQLSFPSIKSNHGNFTFSLSNNQDIEGPQGGFECVQQIGPKNLESLGTLPCKMRIQANDDVYETTRYRMHVAEENNKNKCTRVIKASEPIGRKVKVKGTLRTIPPPSYSNLSTSSRITESSTIPASINTSSKLTSFKSTFTNLAPMRLQSDVQKKYSEIMRRPLKERLIHLLALRPFKRPELYDRINREGIREKEKNIIATVLKQIAFMRDNTYHLHRCVWNDVQEDWPYYTEQEKAMLKRRKPQNLTPPGSSDGGSSGSGQSPNSTHPGSPPSIAAPPLGLLGSKRPGYYQGNDGLPTKRQRISHYRKPESTYSNSLSDNLKPNGLTNISNNWDHKKQLRHQLHNFHHQQQQRNNYTITKSELIPTSDSEEVNSNELEVLSKSNIVSDSLLNNRISYNIHSTLDHNSNHYYYQHQNQERQQQQQQQQQHNINIRKTINSNDEEDNLSVISVEATDEFSSVQVAVRSDKDNKSFRESSQTRYNLTESTYLDKSSNIKISNNPNDSTTRDSFLSFSAPTCTRISPASSENFRNSEFSDYLTCYTTISSSEQRTRYKAEFNAYYKEYRKLHLQVVKISKQFSQLEEELKEKLDNGNTEGYEAIKHQILQEYARTKNVNARFYYLHDKLGHIKKLVSEYDAQTHLSLSMFNNNSQIISTSEVNDNTFHRDVRQTRCVFTRIPSKPFICPSKMSHIS